MAILDISAPNFSQSLVPTIVLKRWLKKTGDTVISGEALYEISNGQKIGQLKANAGGMLIQLLVDDGSILNPNQLLAHLNTEVPADTTSAQDATHAPPLTENKLPTQESKPESKILPDDKINSSAIEDDLKNQTPDDSDTIEITHQISQLPDKIETIFSLIKILSGTAEETEKSRAADRLEILEKIQSAPATEAARTNSAVQKILDRLDLLELQLQTVTSKFSSALEAIQATQVKTLEEVSKLGSIRHAEEHQFSVALAELRHMFSTLEPLPAAAQPQQEPNPEKTEMLSFLNWLQLQNTVTYANLRNRLLPHDLLPDAVIDEINEFALFLTDEPALEQDNDDVIVQSEVLMQVIGAWPGR